MKPYKKQITAESFPQIQQYDTSKVFDTAANISRDISHHTARMAEQIYANNYEVASRTMLVESYDRNRADPRQLEFEQEKIRVGLLKSVPNKMRGEADVRFRIISAPYVQKAKENLYKKTYNDLQSTESKKLDLIVNDMVEQAGSLYSDNLARVAPTIEAFGENLLSVDNMMAFRDGEGNAYFSSAQQGQSKEQVRKIITAGAVSYFDNLSPEGMLSFYENYKKKKVLINKIDTGSTSGFGKMAPSKENTDWPTYERNLKYMEKVVSSIKEHVLKGEEEHLAQNYATHKAKTLLGLDMQYDKYEQMQKDGEDTPIFEILSTMEQIDDLATIAYQTDSQGRSSYILDATKGEYYSEQKRMIPYMSAVIDDIRNNQAKAKSNLGRGLKHISEAVENDGSLNNRDVADIITEYYRAIKKEFGDNTSALLERSNIDSSKRVLTAFRNSITSFYTKQGKTIPPTVNAITIPQGIKTTFIYNGGLFSLPSITENKGNNDTATFKNPFGKIKISTPKEIVEKVRSGKNEL